VKKKSQDNMYTTAIACQSQDSQLTFAWVTGRQHICYFKVIYMLLWFSHGWSKLL